MAMLEKDTSGIVGFILGTGFIGSLTTNEVLFAYAAIFGIAVIVLDRVSCVLDWVMERREAEQSSPSTCVCNPEEIESDRS